MKNAIFNALDFWLGMGVDGLRLDAVPYLYEREGTSCENLPEIGWFSSCFGAWKKAPIRISKSAAS